ncbi:hypothetical protein K2X83_01995 [Patescibacteria group bacterium]|nr:hypothetical protein [Patescibacteria group bacterium]
MENHHYGITDFKSDERVIAVIRHHWFVLFRSVFGIALLFVLPFFILPIFWAIAVQGGSAPGIPGGVVLFFSSMWALIMWNFLFSKWTDYYFDIWVITNMRIVDIDQKGLFKRNVATLLNLDHIQDITFELMGVIGNLLTFGNITIQTAAVHREFRMTEVPAPGRVVQTIREAKIEKMREYGPGVAVPPH